MNRVESLVLPFYGRAERMTQLSDAELAVRCRKGDEEAFEILYNKYSRSLFNFIYRMVGDYDRAKDLYNDAFMRVITARNYQPRAKFSTWVYRIATNLCLNELKKRKHESLEEKLEQGVGFRASTIAPDDYASNEELAERIKNAIDGLTDIQRAVFTLRHYHGLAYRDIARILRCPVGTVKSRLNSAVLALRKTLQEELKEVGANEMHRD
jgi:RNA polymerase sigma-70 factor (ECF subfamily)